MAQYKVTQSYKTGDVAYVEGQILDIDDATAAWMLRDVPGCIVAIKANTPVSRVMESAPVDRMVSAVTRKRGE